MLGPKDDWLLSIVVPGATHIACGRIGAGLGWMAAVVLLAWFPPFALLVWLLCISASRRLALAEG